MRHLLLAVRDVMGRGGLVAVVKLANLERYLSDLPPDNQAPDTRASELSGVVQAIEAQLGRSARGQLIRIGRAAFHHVVAGDKLRWWWVRFTAKGLPTLERELLTLQRLALYLAAPNGDVKVYQEDRRLFLDDAMGDEALVRANTANDDCLTIGLIQACLEWTTGQSFDVTQVSSKAWGDRTSRFEIGRAY